ncbi:hypothetical protein [Bernardetia sp.]|uniref:hypothetical protein n=1 Tax=Bernardetia sp. TaxID=1937974 RepID=UPI0025B94908|nr:hypothetical protein [Bernardetia sp.]
MNSKTTFKVSVVFVLLLINFLSFAQAPLDGDNSLILDSIQIKNTQVQLQTQKKEWLLRLFDGIEITTKHSLEEVKWKPNFYEKIKQLENPSFFYTHLDSTIFYQEMYIQKCVLLFKTRTYSFDTTQQKETPNPFSEYISMASLEYNTVTKNWVLIHFDKNYGLNRLNTNVISLEKIGKEIYSLFLTTYQDEYFTKTSSTTIYDLSTHKDIKTIKIHYDNLGYDLSELETINRDKKISFLQESNTDYYQLIITTFEDNKPIKTESFEYDEIEGYVLKK